MLAAAAAVVPATAHAEAACTWTTTELQVPAGVHVSSLSGDGAGTLATSRWYDKVQAVWQQDVPRTVTFPQSRVVNGVDSAGAVISSTSSAAWRGDQSLEPLPGKTKVFASAMNAGGDVLGTSGSSLAVWPAGSAVPQLLTGTNNGWWWTARGLDNDGNAIANVIAPASKETGYVWDRQGVRAELQPVPGDWDVVPSVIHGGRIFGYSMPDNDFSNAHFVEWNLQGQIVRTHESEIWGANAAGDLLTVRQQAPEDWRHGVLRTDGRFEAFAAEFYPWSFTESGDVYGTLNGDRVVKLRCA
ncbi:hypothetical protein LFM09_38485 [Lentzea alba]|uniref:hypothetical protein n=1 Tax=Lentzea alba TaxID=2714351 RepID=UPI0039BF3A0E